MKDIKRIVIPVDNTEASKSAAERGAFLAKLLGVNAKIITVNDTHQFIASVILEEKLKKEAEAFLESFKKIGEDMGVKVETELVTGNPAEEIVKYTNENDLIIMANHGKKGIDRFMLGSVSEEVVRNAPCSVLVVKTK
jgi:nucleotide-binding universal stress UspA family protein